MLTITSPITEAERSYLIQLLEKNHTEMMHELHHASSREFKARLRAEIELNEGLKAKLAT